MSEDIPLLDNIRIAAPCPANWNEMVGGDRVRYCRSCEKNVYNLSEMSQNDAESLLKTHEGHLCVRYYRRNDGTIMTNNCPVGLRTIRKVYLKTTASAAALCGLVFSAIASMGTHHQESQHSMGDVMGSPAPKIAVPSPPPIAAPPKRIAPTHEIILGAMSPPPKYYETGKMARRDLPEIAAPIVEVSDNTDDDED